MRFKKHESNHIENLILYRETIIEDSLNHKSISEKTYATYKELARLAGMINPVALGLSDMTVSLLSSEGAQDSIEIALMKEVYN